MGAFAGASAERGEARQSAAAKVAAEAAKEALKAFVAREDAGFFRVFMSVSELQEKVGS